MIDYIIIDHLNCFFYCLNFFFNIPSLPLSHFSLFSFLTFLFFHSLTFTLLLSLSYSHSFLLLLFFFFSFSFSFFPFLFLFFLSFFSFFPSMTTGFEIVSFRDKRFF